MSTFTFDDDRMRRRRAASAWSAPLSEQQEMQLAAEALEILSEDELEEFLGDVLRARRYVGLAARSAQHAALAPPDAPLQRVVTDALAHARSARRR